MRYILVMGMTLCLTGCETEIQSGVPEAQANRILVALHQEGIGASKEAEGGRGEPRFAVRVPQDDVSRALSVLRAHNLPRSTEPGFEEVFGEGSLVPTATEERGRYAAALAGELARSIETIDGVLDARVHVAIPDSREFALDEARPEPRASVLVKHRPGRAPYDDEAIRALVAGAVEGMSTERVSVVGVAAPGQPKREGKPLVKVGPVWVSGGSAPMLRTLFAGAAVAAMLLAAGLILLLRRQRRLLRSGTVGAPSTTP